MQKTLEQNILSDIEKLKNALNSTNNPSDKFKINDALSHAYDNILYLQLESKNFQDTKLTLDEKYHTLKEDIIDFMPYLDFVKQFSNSLKKIEFVDYDISKIKPLPDKINKEEYLTLVNDFFRTTDKEIYKLFSKTYKNRNEQFYFIDKSKGDSVGETWFIPYLDKCYINQIYSQDMPLANDILTGPHEFGHSIGALLNPNRYVNSLPLKEIEAFFFELISVDFFDKTFNGNMFSYEAYNNLFNYKCETYAFNNIIQLYNKYINLVENGKLIRELSKKGQKKFKNEIIEQNEAYSVLNYLISYIIAIDLYLLYQIDKEKALYELKKIVRSEKIGMFKEINKIHEIDSAKKYNKKLKLNIKTR